MSKMKIKFRSAVMGVAGAATLLAGLPLAMQAVNAGVGDAPVVSFLETFDGTPAAPQAWDGEQWDVTVHSREREWQDKMAPVNAVHGMNCAGGMENRHLVEQYADAVFACNGHVMTAVNSGDLGYAVAYLTPNHMVDFSSGTATIKLDVSTLQSSGRDWWDLWISPYEENVQLVGESWYPDLNGAPRHGVLVSARDANLHAQIYDNFAPLQFPAWPTDRVTGNPHLKWSDFLVPDAKRRDTVEIQISRTHLKIGFPAYNQWFVDTDIPALSWSSGTVQIGHHSYTPQKDCGTSTAAGWNGSCEAGTWHWDNVSISPAIPFSIIKSDKREVTVAPQLSQGTYSAPQTVTFAQPAPANANLRFTAYDDNTVQVSLDGGVTWVDPARQAGSNSPREWHYNSFWMPIPQGVQTVMFRGRDQINIPWRARDISIWSRTVTTTGTTPTTAPATTAPATTAPATTAPATTAPATTAPATTAPATTAPANNNQNSAGRFATIPAGQALPSEATCASRVRPAAEIRSGNATYNATRVNVANTTYSRVTGNYSGTTDEILQWAACKWGIDEDIVRAQVAQESWWQQTAGGDMTSDQNACYPAVRTSNGSQCAESLGLSQVRFAYHSSAFVDGNAYRSSAYNVDYLYGLIRSCLDGEMTWLNTVERGSEYAAGDLWGCLGVWFSGRWHTPAAEQYIQNVQSLLNQRIWTTSGFIGATTPTPPTTAPATTAPATTAPATTAPATTAPPTTTPAGSGTPTGVAGTWQRIDPPVNLALHGVDQFGFKSMESSPSRPGTIYVGTSYEGLWKTTNGGASWVKTNTGTNGAALDRGRLWALAVDPTNADIVYTTPGYGGGGLYKSVDGGVNWTQMLPQSITSQTTAHVYSIDLDPADPRHILLGSHQPWGYPNSAGVIESRDGGVTWIVHQPGSQWGWGNYALFLDSTTWLVGTQDNGFWRTTNSGGSWTRVSTRNMSHGGTDITRGTNGTLYVGAVNTLLRSTNGGASFTEVGPFRFDGGYYDIGNDGTNLWIQRAYPVQGLLSNSTYYTSPIGDGVNWTAQPGGQMFGNGSISMVFDPTTRTLYSANLMAGIWKLTLAGGTSPTPPPTTVPAPVTTAPAPVTTAPAPVTTAPAPVTTAPAPVTTAPAPVTTVPAPVTTVPTTRTAVTPTGVAARPTATRTITVTWTAVPGRTYEIIYSRVGRTGSRVVRSLTQGSFSITRLVNGATYVFQVREKVDGTTSTWSAPVSAKATSRIV